MRLQGFGKKAAGAVASLALVGGAVAVSASAVSADPGDVTFEIEPGEFSRSLGEVDFAPVQYALHTQASAAEGELTVTDMRGSEAGWSVSLEASDLIGPNGTIDADNIEFVSAVNIASLDGNAADAVSGAGEQTLGSAREVLSAASGKGAGTFTADIDLNLHVGAGQQSGAYEGTITVTSNPVVP